MAKKLAKKVKPVSVSGYFHDLIIVGRDAKPSAMTAKRIAIIGKPMILQTMIAINENIPQIKSNLFNFQKLFGLIKEIVKTINGRNPDKKIRVVAQISAPAERAAPVPMSGATDHINQLMRLGFDFPLMVSRI